MNDGLNDIVETTRGDSPFLDALNKMYIIKGGTYALSKLINIG